MNKNWIFAIVLGVLVIVSLVQAVQLNSLKTSLSEGKITTGSASAGTSLGSSTSTGASSSANSLSSLPQQVGGC